MTARRDCSVCTGAFALRVDGTLRKHAPPSGVVGLDHCPGGGKPPRTWADPPPAAPAPAQVDTSPPCGCALDAQGQPTDVWPGCLLHACDHWWSGWTRVPGTGLDFRRCLDCGYVQLQDRPPCALCGGGDTRAYQVPGHGTAYVCSPCMGAL